jgi:hypothetical protein
MNPSTLYDIYLDLIHKRHYMGITCFRVRDVQTCMDYLICNSEMWKWDYQNLPKQLWALLLEPNFNSYYPMPADEPVYCLLSTPEELNWFKTIGTRAAPDAVRKGYQ